MSSRGHPKVTISDTPAHGVAVIAEREAHPAFTANSPLSACNAASLPALGITYTPAPDLTGDDTLTINEVGLDGRRQVTRIDLKVL